MLNKMQFAKAVAAASPESNPCDVELQNFFFFFFLCSLYSIGFRPLAVVVKDPPGGATKKKGKRGFI